MKMARIIRDSVSGTIRNNLSDPRITGLVSITEVDISPDAKNATVFLSVFGTDETAARLTFTAISHAVGHIQAILGKDMPGRSCPHIRFERDTKMKKTLETLKLIDQAGREYETTGDDDADENEPDTFLNRQQSDDDNDEEDVR